MENEAPEMDDTESLMDQCAMEMMNAMESKDKGAFRDSFRVLVAHTMHEMGTDENSKEDDES